MRGAATSRCGDIGEELQRSRCCRPAHNPPGWSRLPPAPPARATLDFCTTSYPPRWSGLGLMQKLRAATLIIAILFCLTPWASPPLALAIGVAIALTIGHPWPAANSRATRILLQACVIGLGFGMNLQQVLRAGSIGIAITVVSIVATVLA